MKSIFGRILITVTSFAALLAVWLAWPKVQNKSQSPPHDFHSSARDTRYTGKAHETSIAMAKVTDDTLPLEQRLEIVRSIRADLVPGDVNFLLSNLGRAASPGREGDWWVILNEIMEQMRKNGVGAELYSKQLSLLIKDDKQPPTVRDYAIQHLAQWLAPSDSTAPREEIADLRASGLAVIADAIRDPSSMESTVSGTGLMALADASSRLDPKDTTDAWSQLDTFLVDVISGSSPSSLSTRISAVQTAAIRRNNSSLPLIRKLALSETTPPSLRLGSIAALGFFADPSDQAFLQSLANSKSRFQYAAKAALERSATPR